MKPERTMAILTTANIPAISSTLASWSGGIASEASSFAYSSHPYWPPRSHQRRSVREVTLPSCSEAIRTWGRA